MDLTTIKIIKTDDRHFEDIIEVEKKAFGHDKEAELTAGLLKDPTGTPILSLLAMHNDQAVGHILFTRAYIDDMTPDQPLFHILAPLAVIPDYQKKGIGGLLIREGLTQLKAMGSKMVFLLGHIDYYPRHGFINDARQAGYHTIYPIPEKVKDAWMYLSLTSEDFPIKKGKVFCCDEMNQPEHWRE